MNKKRLPKNESQAIVPCQKKEVHGLLSRYQDNELDAVWREKISAHLEECSACRFQLQELAQVTRALQTLPEVDTSPYFTQQLMATVTQHYREKRSWSNLFAMPSLVYSLVFIVFLGLGLWGIGALSQPDMFPSNNDLKPQVQESDFTRVFSQSQQLSLLHVQAQSFELFAQNGNATSDTRQTEGKNAR